MMSEMKSMPKFNKAQKQAVEHNKGPMMVLAGPGAGKTLVITYRTKTLIEKYGVEPGKILVITFNFLFHSFTIYCYLGTFNIFNPCCSIDILLFLSLLYY